MTAEKLCYSIFTPEGKK